MCVFKYNFDFVFGENLDIFKPNRFGDYSNHNKFLEADNGSYEMNFKSNQNPYTYNIIPLHIVFNAHNCFTCVLDILFILFVRKHGSSNVLHRFLKNLILLNTSNVTINCF